jgi:hypothetical protein
MPVRKNKEQFIKDCFKKHDNNFDYSLVKYVSSTIPVTVRCILHDNIFEITPKDHLRTISGGCKFCISENQSKNFRKIYTQFKIDASKVHNNY